MADHESTLYAIRFSNGWQYTPSADAAEDAQRQGLEVVEFVPASHLRGAVEENERLRETLRVAEANAREYADQVLTLEAEAEVAARGGR